jgi:hypothetical protein
VVLSRKAAAGAFTSRVEGDPHREVHLMAMAAPPQRGAAGHIGAADEKPGRWRGVGVRQQPSPSSGNGRIWWHDDDGCCGGTTCFHR